MNKTLKEKIPDINEFLERIYRIWITAMGFQLNQYNYHVYTTIIMIHYHDLTV